MTELRTVSVPATAILDHGVAGIVDDVDIVAETAGHGVRARSAVEDVVARRTLDDVVAATAAAGIEQEVRERDLSVDLDLRSSPVGVCAVTVVAPLMVTSSTAFAPTGRRSILSMPDWKSLIVSTVDPDESPTLR